MLSYDPMSQPPNVFLVIPAYGRMVCTECCLSVIKLVTEFQKLNIKFSIAIPDLHDIGQVRNLMASRVANSNEFTHLLMLDNDMEVDASTIIAMLRSGNDVIGCAYPKRTGEQPIEFAFSGQPKKTETPDIFTVDAVGAGVMLVSRTAILTMIEKCSLRRQSTHQFRLANGDIFGFFDRIELPDTMLWPEDYSFCHRWKSLGGEVYMITNHTVGHVNRTIMRAKWVVADQ